MQTDYRVASSKPAESPAEKKPKPKFDKVVDGATLKKPGLLSEIFKNFIEEDAVTVRSYVIKEVIKPGIKTVLANVINTSIDMFFWGRGGKTANSTPGAKVSYNNYYGQVAQQKPAIKQAPSTSSYFFADPEYDTRDKADTVLRNMREALAVYDNVSINDLYDLSGITGTMRPNDNKYGWFDLTNAKVVRRPDGKYVIDFPNAVPIE